MRSVYATRNMGTQNANFNPSFIQLEWWRPLFSLLMLVMFFSANLKGVSLYVLTDISFVMHFEIKWVLKFLYGDINSLILANWQLLLCWNDWLFVTVKYGRVNSNSSIIMMKYVESVKKTGNISFLKIWKLKGNFFLLWYNDDDGKYGR